MLLVLLVLTGCRTRLVREDPDAVYREEVASLVPEVPELPEFPSLSWQYDRGLYSIGEEDVDKLLDYRDNQLEEYRIRVEIWSDQMKIIVRELSCSSEGQI